MLTLALLGLARAEPDPDPAEALAPPPVAIAAPRGLDDAATLAPRTPTAATGRLVIVPGMGWNAAPDQSVTGFSTGLVAHGADLEGLDLQWGGSWLTGDLSGLQATMAYAVADDVHGIQSTLGLAWARGDVHVAQLGLGANVAEGSVRGLQATAGLNVAGEGFDGVQASSGVNLAGGDSEGIQASAGLNVADALQGVQAAPVNVAQEVRGLQLGLVNVGRHVEGVQLGLVNVAETSDVSIAPINLVKDGLHRVDVWASESATATVAAKIGSKNVYTLLGAGWIRPDQTWWTFGGGFGLHFGQKEVWTELDVSAWGIADGNRLVPGVHHKLRGSVGLALAPAFQPFVGVSMNGWYGDGYVWPRAVEIPQRLSPDRRYAAWPGAHVGVSF